MVKRVMTKVIEEIETEEEGAPARPVRRRSRLPWLVWRGTLLLALLGGLLYFAPAILVTTGLWKPLLGQFVPPLAGKIDAASLSLGWFSPITVKDLVIRDEGGEIMAQVVSFRSEKSLFSLAQDQTSLGRFDVEEPRGKITLRGDGSNVEDLIARFVKDFPTKDPSSTGALPTFSLALTRGTLELDDEISGQRWELTGIQMDVDSLSPEPTVGKLSGLLKRLANSQSKASIGKSAPAEQPAGEFTADLNWQPAPVAGGNPAGLGAGKVTCELKSAPAEIAEGLLRRFAADLRPAGALSGTLVYEWKDNFSAQRVDIIKLSSPQLALASPTYLAGDKPSLRLESASGGIELAGNRLLLDRLQLQSDVAALSASLAGEFPTWDLAGFFAAMQSAKKDDGMEISGEVDLAAVAHQLPATLRMRKDSRITEGLLDFSLKSGLAQGERAWEATANTSRLVAETAGRRVTWEQPVEFAATARQTKAGIVIDRLSGKSSFATLQGEGTLEAGSITAQADLDKLVLELGRFVDWTGIDLAGKLDGQVKWERGADNAFAANAEAHVQNFQLAAPGLMPWRERDLQIMAVAQGQADASGIKQIAAADLTVLSGSDKLTAQLQKPVTNISVTGAWPLAFVLQGDLATWLPRVQPFVPLAGWQVSGGVVAEGAGEFSSQRFVIAPTKVTLTQLAAASTRLSIREAKVVLETAGTVDLEARSFTSASTTFASSALAFRADDLQASFGTAGTSLSGHVEYRARLEILSAWLGAPQFPRTWQLGGDVVGAVDARMENGAVQASLSTEIENLAYSTRSMSATQAGVAITPTAAASPWQVAWTEPKVSLSGEASYDPQKDRLELRSAKLDSAALALAAAGSIEQLAGEWNTNLQGNIGCDMAGISEKLRPILGNTLRITGREERKFSLAGPLFAAPAATVSTDPAAVLEISALGGAPKTSAGFIPNELTAAAGIGWQSAEYYGLSAGAASVESRLEKGIVTVGPLDIPLSEGKLTAQPRLFLNDPGMPVTLEKGPLLENVRISPELCRGWLKYVQPILADATRAEGKFSLALEQTQVPLLAPKSAAIRSTLTIHQGQVGPGPLATQYLGVVQRVRGIIERKGEAATIDPNKGWIIFPPQQVPVSMQDQRVHHQGMTMQIGNAQVATQGSVGLDDSLDLLLIIPVHESWLRDPKAGIFKGKIIRVPIRGSVTAPKPDLGGVLSDLTKQIAGGAVKDLFQGELNKGKALLDRDAGKMIDKLFGPKPKP